MARDFRYNFDSLYYSLLKQYCEDHGKSHLVSFMNINQFLCINVNLPHCILLVTPLVDFPAASATAPTAATPTPTTQAPTTQTPTTQAPTTATTASTAATTGATTSLSTPTVMGIIST